jgi:hypothetical protein
LLFTYSCAIIILEEKDEGSCTGKAPAMESVPERAIAGKVRQLSQMSLYGGLDIIRGNGPKISP